jgi:hypothetical protein
LRRGGSWCSLCPSGALESVAEEHAFILESLSFHVGHRWLFPPATDIIKDEKMFVYASRDLVLIARIAGLSAAS